MGCEGHLDLCGSQNLYLPVSTVRVWSGEHSTISVVIKALFHSGDKVRIYAGHFAEPPTLHAELGPVIILGTRNTERAHSELVCSHSPSWRIRLILGFSILRSQSLAR